ncbi:PP2C family protein-serine/threonine phosphatase [Roseibium denhamense]|uniref:Serine phosphatase RsbU, regulator of sigma subunit n=1 Tax=Roseibium denhamense TaxID=76305 RepID=A0ABY1NWZ2_9HYPH|nr:SpoIIE family protein phosphatase [Roseibium denhamense]SMP20320.1 Serine phosphatase RsbU, regulator of sigma subunit [Roseibium denhamense]
MTVPTSSVAKGMAEDAGALQNERDQLKAELDALKAEHADLQLLYEATIEHGEAVEDQLAENNILLQQTQERLEAELKDAGSYVMSILPAPRAQGPRADWLLVPSTELGGDSFGYHDLDSDHFAIYLIDVCGHGVGAALLSVSIINVLRSCALPDTDFSNPSEVLFKLNNAFPMERQNNMFFTIWYGVYKRSTGMLAYASGGHPAAVLLRKGEDGNVQTSFIGSDEGMVIGAIGDMVFEQDEVRMQSGDRLLVLSDGTYEVEGVDSAVLTLEGLAEEARAASGPVAGHIYDWLKRLSGQAELPDDYTMIELAF